MAKTTVRLDDEERQLLERLAPKFGGRQGALREALRLVILDDDILTANPKDLKTISDLLGSSGPTIRPWPSHGSRRHSGSR